MPIRARKKATGRILDIEQPASCSCHGRRRPAEHKHQGATKISKRSNAKNTHRLFPNVVFGDVRAQGNRRGLGEGPKEEPRTLLISTGSARHRQA